MKISFIVFLISLLFSVASFGEVPTGSRQLEKHKYKIVSRIYQATYGQTERCKKAPPEIAVEFQNELTRFVEVNENLMGLVIHSPYYELARQKFAKHEVIDPVRDTPEKLGMECDYLAQGLRSLIDTPEGKKSLKEFEEILSE